MLANQQSEVAHDVIESLVQLTEQRDEHALLRSLLGAVVEMMPGTQASIVCLAVSPDQGVWRSDNIFPMPESPFPIAGWLVDEVVSLNGENSSRVVAHAGQDYLIASLSASTDRRKAMVMRQPSWSETDLRLVKGMLKIHANYSGVLFDSERDTLTGLYNRKKLEQKLGELLVARARGQNRKTDPDTADYLAVFDIDHFKRINDTFGHLIGDEVLLTFAGLVRNALRDVDWVFRYGGEEFIALVKSASPESIETILARIRLKVQNHVFPQVGQITVSVGYTPIADQQLPPHVIEEADKALYYAKEHGRNQVCGYRELVRLGEISAGERVTGSIEFF